jgi:hypothetical protein
LAFVVQEVAVVQGLQAEVVEVQVALVLQGRTQAGQVKLGQLLVEQLGSMPFLMNLGKYSA